MKYNCVFIAEKKEIAEEEERTFFYFYDVKDKILYKTDDERMDPGRPDRKKSLKEWLRDSWKGILVAAALFAVLLVSKDNPLGVCIVFLADLAMSLYLRHRAIKKRAVETQELKQSAQIVEMEVGELAQLYKESAEAKEMKLMSSLLAWLGPIVVILLMGTDLNYEWMIVWLLLSEWKYRSLIDALPGNLYQLSLILKKKDDTAVTSLLIGMILFIHAICYLLIASFYSVSPNAQMLENPLVLIVYGLSIFNVPLAIIGLVSAVWDRKAGKKMALFGILLNILMLLVGVFMLMIEMMALLVAATALMQGQS